MKELQKGLFFCQNCSSTTTLLISSCMHITCSSCTSQFTTCQICHSTTDFIQLSDELRKTLSVNPTTLLEKPSQIIMFQLESAMNKILCLEEERKRHWELLVRAKGELARLKKWRGGGLSSVIGGRNVNDDMRDVTGKSRIKSQSIVFPSKYKTASRDESDSLRGFAFKERTCRTKDGKESKKAGNGAYKNTSRDYLDTIKFSKRMMKSKEVKSDKKSQSFLKQMCESNRSDYSTEMDSECTTTSTRITIPVKRSKRFFYRKR